MKKEQKYFSEAAVLQATKGVALIKPAELPAIAKSPKALAELAEAHIYFVCQRPRIRLVKGGTRKSDGLRFTLNITDKGERSPKNFSFPTNRSAPKSPRLSRSATGRTWSSPMGSSATSPR